MSSDFDPSPATRTKEPLQRMVLRSLAYVGAAGALIAAVYFGGRGFIQQHMPDAVTMPFSGEKLYEKTPEEPNPARDNSIFPPQWD